MSELTPALWTRYLADEAPPFGTHQSKRYVDEANTAYAVDNLFNEDHAVTVVWLPETDSVSHSEYRGQFGVARRTIVEADGLIGEMVGELKRRGRFENTYLLLVSDHGHLGGRFAHLERYDLVLSMIDESLILIANRQRGLAIVDRVQRADRTFLYRYQVVRNVRASNDGSIHFELVTRASADPLRMARAVSAGIFGRYHDEQSWLKITMGTVYSDSVVSMCRHMLWQPHLSVRARDFAADLVITANPDWQFCTHNKPGTAHGHPFVETMRMSFFVAEPNIRRETIVTDPVRSVDLLPTVLEMAGVSVNKDDFDGRPIRSIYESPQTETQNFRMPLIWQDLDLGAWAPRQYAPRDIYPVQPTSVNRPDSFWDLNNVARNALSVTELSVNRLFDDTVRLIGFRQRPTRTAYRWTQRELSRNGVMLPDLQLNKVALGDYSWYSSGNLQRINNGTDWVQRKVAEADAAIAAPLGAHTVLGTPLTNGAIDIVQYSAWELRRVGTFAATTVLDRWLLDGLEDRTDRVINFRLGEPAER